MDTMVGGVNVETVEVDQQTSTVRTQFDLEKTPPSVAVTASLAEVKNADPVELDPLYSTIDPDALDAIVRIREGTEGDILARFVHEECAITVSSYGVITISDEHDPTAEHWTHDDD